MLLSNQAVSYLHINDPLPDSPEWRSDLALCFSYKIFLTVYLNYCENIFMPSIERLRFIMNFKNAMLIGENIQ